MVLKRMGGRLPCKRLTTREFYENLELFLQIVISLNFKYMVSYFIGPLKENEPLGLFPHPGFNI